MECIDYTLNKTETEIRGVGLILLLLICKFFWQVTGTHFPPRSNLAVQKDMLQ